MGLCTRYTNWSQPGGSTPPQLPARTEPIPSASDGSKGSFEKVVSQEYILSAALDPIFIGMLLSAASRAYINEDRIDALQRLTWLKRHLTPLASLSDYVKVFAIPANQLQSISDTSKRDDKYYQATLRRTDALLTQLALGLNYYGLPENHVTLLSQKYFDDQLDRAFVAAKSVEQSYLAYEKAKSEQDDWIASLGSTRLQVIQQTYEKETAKASLTAQEPALISSIETLGAERDRLWLIVQQADRSFKLAVEARGPGCNFVQIVGIVAALASVVATGGTAIAAIAAAAPALNGTLANADGTAIPDTLAGFKYRVSTIETAGSDVGSFVKAANAAGDALKPKPVPGSSIELPSDEVKILASEADIEKQLQPFMDMPEAQAYVLMLRQYSATCIARNNKIIELNAAVAQLARYDAEIIQLRNDSDRLQTAIAQKNNPFIAEATQYMEAAWIDSRASLMRLLFMVQSAYRYYSLDATASVPVDDFSIAALQSARLQILSNYVQAKDRAGTAPAKIKRAPISLRDLMTQGALRQFQKDKKLSFTLPPSHPTFLSLASVYIGELDVVFKTAAGTFNTFDITIVNHGRALIFDVGGGQHAFSHQPISVPLIKSQGKTLTSADISSQDYVGVSPYGPWTIVLNSVPNASLESLTDVIVYMTGIAYARSH